MLKISLGDSMTEELAVTHEILLRGGLCIHGAVERVTLHGSRGLKGGARPDSDLDICLVVSIQDLARATDQNMFLRSVLNTTIENWRSSVELDLAVIFDKSGCALRCMEHRVFRPGLCNSTIDCMGLFKTQKGFDGFVLGPIVDCSKMYPLMTIWARYG